MIIPEAREHLLRALREGLRFDGRAAHAYRPIEITRNITKNAEGSARVKIGDTEVIAGVKFEVGTPFPDKPTEGSIMVNTELIPFSSPEFESGPPGIESIELARVVDRGIRESKAIDFKKLCIKEGEQAWIALIDIVPLNASGNLFDAFALAALVALRETKFPALVDRKIDYHQSSGKTLSVEKKPISVTVHKIGDILLIDPTREEEHLCEARLTVTSMDNDILCALQKGGDGPLTVDEINAMVTLAIEKARELRKLI